MSLKYSPEEARERAAWYMSQDYGCGPAVLHTMWEAYGLENEDFLWASAALRGGIGGHRKGVCGALASSAVCLGLRNITPLNDPEAVEKARETVKEKAKQIAEDFEKEFGNIICEKLADFGPPDSPPDPEVKKREAERVCIPCVQFCVQKLCELDNG